MDWTTFQIKNETLQEQLDQLKKWSKQKSQIEKQLKHAELTVESYERLLKESYEEINMVNEQSFLAKLKRKLQKGNTTADTLLETAALREVKLTEAQVVRDDLQEELLHLVNKLNATDEKEIKAKLELNKIQMKSWLEEHAPQKGAQLQTLLEQKQLAKTLLKEINEALDAGEDARTALTEAGIELNNAHDYSTWDTFLGGGIYVTHIKHEKIRVSNTYLHKAQRALQKFKNELLDLEGIEFRALEMNFDGFVKFSDYFFDDIFSAWSVHTKINGARNQLVPILDDVTNAINKLNGQKAVTEQKIALISEDIVKIYTTDVTSLNL